MSTVPVRRLLGIVLLFFGVGCDDPTTIPAPASLAVSTPATVLDAGDTLVLSAEARSSSGATLPAAQVAWSSGDPLVLGVEGGRVVGRAPGSAWVRATTGAATDSVLLVVEPRVAHLSVWPADTIRVILGRRATLFPEITDESGAAVVHSLEIVSSAPAAIGVDGRTLSALSPGSATVMLRAGRRSVSVVVEVVSGERYEARSLGAFDARALNNLGWVAGVSGGQAALWRDGSIEHLPLDAFASSEAVLVNDSGTVVGTAVPSPGSTPVLWTWRAGALRLISLDGPPGAGPIIFVSASDLNQRGEIVGAVRTRDASYPFHWDGTRLRWLDRPAVGINNHGSIVGGRSIIENGVAREIPAPVPGAEWWGLKDINDSGWYTGSYFVPDRVCSFLSNGSTVVVYSDLCAMGAHVINRYGDLLFDYNGPSPSAAGQALVVRDGRQFPVALPFPHRGIALNDLGQVLVRSNRTSERLLLSPAN